MGTSSGSGANTSADPGLGVDVPLLEDGWKSRALALTLACGALGQWNLDMSRHARERLQPADYASMSYYEKWLAALADLLVETRILSRGDLAGEPAALPESASGRDPHPLADRALAPERVADALSAGSPSTREGGPPPRFEIGQEVRTRRPAGNALVDGGHTRLPAYASGALGRIERLHGAHVFPDSSAHGLGDSPEPLYGVRFAVSELWLAPENPRDEVVLDLWQSYLEPA